MKEINLENTFEIAQKKIRVLAFLIDFTIYATIVTVLVHFFGGTLEDALGFRLNVLATLTILFMGFFLWPISEGLWGQTIGKRIFKLKVLSNDYKPIEMGSAVLRALLGFIDYIFLAGLIVATTNDKNKRIGDFAAKTIVVQLKKENL
jgi:uncharacterized RDD family membrane protein YckC